MMTQADPSTAKIVTAMIPWYASADLNAATTKGLSTPTPEFIPGTAPP